MVFPVLLLLLSQSRKNNVEEKDYCLYFEREMSLPQLITPIPNAKK